MTLAKLVGLVRNDYSAVLLLASNLAMIALAVAEGWSLGTLMLVYWIQSIIIGFFTVIKILSLQRFAVEGVKVNGQPISESLGTKIGMAGFFAVHFGIFHFVYLIFIAGIAISGGSLGNDFTGIVLASLVFLVNHAFSFWYNRTELQRARPNIGTVMGTPYARIIPMHLTIIFGFGFLGGGASIAVIVFFLLLKTAADLVMHLAEHHAANLRRMSVDELIAEASVRP
ncbi:MAG: DUF6498-containing protein [Candidatus Diapherotrites archaeon]|nr:DUF6498-containing protein [Candidatus Diapherotrites archaeon]